MFGAIMDAVGQLANFQHQEEMQRDAQVYNAESALRTQGFQERMSNTALQRYKADAEAAGFNPLLAFHGGGASTPMGATASIGSGHQNIHTNMQQGAQSAAQIDLIEATADKERAEAEEIRKRTPRHEWDIEEIKARIPTHPAAVAKMEQEIGESAIRIERIWAEERHHIASAKHLEQQISNLKETIPLIREQVKNYRALTEQSSAVTDETRQRIKENLPKLEGILMNLERLHRQSQQPGQENEARAHDSLIGQIGAYLRAINPLNGFLGVVPSPRSRNVHNSTTIINRGAK